MGAHCCATWNASRASLQAVEPGRPRKPRSAGNAQESLEVDDAKLWNYAAEDVQSSTMGNTGQLRNYALVKVQESMVVRGVILDPVTVRKEGADGDHAMDDALMPGCTAAWSGSGRKSAQQAYENRGDRAASRSRSRGGEESSAFHRPTDPGPVRSIQPSSNWNDWRSSKDTLVGSKKDTVKPVAEMTPTNEGNDVICKDVSFEECSCPTIPCSDEGEGAEEWLTLQCAKGFPLILVDGDWNISKQPIAFHEWVEYALWIQRDEFPEWSEIKLRSETPQGQLVSYQVQVLASQKEQLNAIFMPVWEDMRKAYRLPRNHGGTSAPMVRWDAKARFKTSRMTSERTSSPSSATHTSGSVD
eukprot:TRINITY_DN8906_c0_g1_i1.p1 TRINITY_DN8906_c0_g1~~TRINITY_DN8906_c0_g1_i1.p1  ORF type:complete len:358 (-),score=39.46 TRINITY_DN8906_c0_g1_i1:679-1752(-)